MTEAETIPEAPPDPDAENLIKLEIETAREALAELVAVELATADFYMATESGYRVRLDAPEALAAVRGVLADAGRNVLDGRPLPFAFLEVSPEVARQFPGVARAEWAKRANTFYVAGRLTPQNRAFTLVGFSLPDGDMTVPQANMIADTLLHHLAEGQAAGMVVLGSA